MIRYTQPPLTPAKTYLQGIPKGYLGTRKTLKHIQALIREGAKDFYVRQKAIDILLSTGVQPKDYRGEIKALFEWVKQNVRYTKDPFQVEVLHSARRMLELRAGDCDDMTILLGAMLESIGHPVHLVIIGPDPLKPKFFSHIYLEVNHKGQWIPLDPTMPVPAGWAPRAFVKKVVAMNRRQTNMSGKFGLQGTATTPQPGEWLSSLMRAIQGEAVQPRDPRVRNLFLLLRQRGVWGRNQWMRSLLRRIWRRGLAARQRPRTTRRVAGILRRSGLWPARATGAVALQRAVPIRRDARGVPTSAGRGLQPPLRSTALPSQQRLRFFPLRRVGARSIGRLRPVGRVRPVGRARPSGRLAGE